jgi:hypothetical protein
LTERRVEGATILGGPLMVACVADYGSLGSGSAPTLDVGKRALVDELDVADLDSEQEHHYVLGAASPVDDVIESLGERVDGGRANRLREQLRLRIEPEGLLVLRLSSAAPGAITLWAAGRKLGPVPLPSGRFQEVAVAIPPGTPSGAVDVVLMSPSPLTLLHYWSFSRVL